MIALDMTQDMTQDMTLDRNQDVTPEHDAGQDADRYLLPLFHYRHLVYDNVKGACARMSECTGGEGPFTTLTGRPFQGASAATKNDCWDARIPDRRSISWNRCPPYCRSVYTRTRT